MREWVDRGREILARESGISPDERERLANLVRNVEFEVELLPTPKETATALYNEWTRQADRLSMFFAHKLKMSYPEYKAGLPRFTPQPDVYKGRLDTPVIVETRFSLASILEILEIKEGPQLNIFSIKSWTEDNFTTPNEPYTTWIDAGLRTKGKSAEEVRFALKPDERGGTVYDGIALYIATAKDLRYTGEWAFLLPGSEGEDQKNPDLAAMVPTLFYFPFLGRQLNLTSVNASVTNFGSIIAGKEIGLKSKP